jgi:anti-sigma regulatory factor (Ser/Thr protein kinase)
MRIQSWPASLESIPGMRAFIKAEAELMGFDPRSVGLLELVVEEIAVNIVEYAYKNDPSQSIEMGTEKKNKELTIHVFDRGAPFDPLKVPAPDIEAPAGERAIGGLGLFMVKRIVDEMRYERRDGKNHVILIKRA